MTTCDLHQCATHLGPPRHGVASLTLAMIGALLLGGCTSAAAAGDAPTSEHAPSKAGRLDPSDVGLEQEVFDLVNRHRTARGLRALAFDPRIAREARRHSAAMAAGSQPFGHGGFPDRAAALGRVMSCRLSAENISSSQGYRDPAPEVVRGWLASSGHRTNIEDGRYDTTGIGVARSATGKVYFTQIFVGH